ncbi:MAG: penicillin-binding protein activator LpoB [Planctomycetes bacterium]|nr:penicillin-binding protein activator LpoB [Planctomycetota bacterium]
MRHFLIILLMLGFVAAASGYGTGCRQSTREDLDDDEVGPESSGPYSMDLLEVTDEIASQMEKQKITERFIAKYGEAPIIAVIRPQNDTRFPEVSQIFQEDLVVELMDRYTRDEMRFSQRDSDVQDAVAAEKEAKEGGERTDRTGRRTKLGADYFLKAKFSTLSMTDGEYEDDTILYTFELIDTETDELIFKGGHKIRRVSEKSAVYR